MPRPSRALLLCLAVLCGFFGAARDRSATRLFAQPLAVTRPSSKAIVRLFTLASGEARTQELAENEVHHYPFFMKAGQVLVVSVDQAPRKKDPVDVSIHLQDPKGRTLYAVDHLRGIEGQEEAHLVAQAAGFYAVEISGLTAGVYRIHFRLHLRASKADRLLAQAEATYCEAKNRVGEQGIERFLAASALWRQAGDKARQTDALQKVVEASPLQQKAEAARLRRLAERVAELRRELGDPKMEAEALLFVGSANKDLGHLVLAERAYRKALRLTLHHFPDQAAAAMRNLGILLANRGDRYAALNYLERSEQLLPASDKPNEHWKTLESLGQAYKSLGETNKALDYFRQCVDLAEKLADDDLLAKSFTRIGDAYQAQREFDSALSFYKRSIPLRRKVGNPGGEAVVLSDMSLIYRELNEFQQALRLQQEALVTFRQVGDLVSQAKAYCSLGLILLDGKDPIQANQNLERCANLANDQGLRELEITSFYGQAQAQRDQNNPYLARLAVGKALKLIEEVGPREGIGNNLVNSRANSYELLIDLLVSSQQGRDSRSDVEEAFEASERARWRALLDSLGSDPQRVSLLMSGKANLAARHSRLVEEIEGLEDEIRRSDSESPRLAKLKRQRTAKFLALRTLESRLRAPTAGSLKPVTVREAQQLLDPDTVVLEYYLGRSRSFLFLLTSSDLEVFALPGRSDLESACAQYHLLLSKSQTASGARLAEIAGRRLGELLLGPVAERLVGNKHLLIVPDGAIHRVPFGALPTLSGNRISQQVLLDTHSISFVPSLSVLRAIRLHAKRRSVPTMDVAVLAAPDLGSESSPLPYSRKEGEDVLALAPPNRRLGAFGADASRSLVLSGKLNHYRYILFSTHGEENPEQPEMSSLAVSGREKDGRPRTDHIWLQDIKGLNLSAELVVLSACRTALGSNVPGEGALGLPQGFLSAGSARVAVSLWDVNDLASAVMSVKLFRGVLGEKLSPSEALREAQLALRKSKDWNSPYYWAAFELYGDYH